MNIRNGVAIFVAIAALLASAGAAAFGGGPAAVRKQVEASMLVTGKIDVDSNGTVSGFSLDRQEKLPPGVVELLGKSVPTWKFEPVLMEGKPTNVRTTMNIRLVARKLDDTNYGIEIRSAGSAIHPTRRPSVRQGRNSRHRAIRRARSRPAWPARSTCWCARRAMARSLT
jgi:hypothetical protein